MAAENKSDQSGQALIELIIFLPLMFTLYSMISGFASSINGSINQQKVTRAYFYYRVQNNSTVPKPDEELTYQGWNRFGMYFVGWKDKMIGDDPVAPCYHITIPMNGSNSEDCDQRYTQDSTQYIRVGTAYGICGATYASAGGQTVLSIPDGLGISPALLLDPGSCLIE